MEGQRDRESRRWSKMGSRRGQPLACGSCIHSMMVSMLSVLEWLGTSARACSVCGCVELNSQMFVCLYISSVGSESGRGCAGPDVFDQSLVKR